MTDRQKAWARDRLLNGPTGDKAPLTKVGDHGPGEINPKHINISDNKTIIMNFSLFSVIVVYIELLVNSNIG